MNLVLLSGGSGKRLWPLSNDVRSKQFIKVLKNPDGQYESMVQRVYRQVRSTDTDVSITIATSKSQVSEIVSQLGDNVDICIEPCRRDTFPAIVLACLYLHYVKKVSLDEVVVVSPVDPYVEDSYFETLKKLSDLTDQTNESNLSLIGIEPTYPSEKYGYIIPNEPTEQSFVKMFKEKPAAEVAQQYISEGALWNSGVFAFKLGYLINKAHELVDFTDYADFLSKYDTVQKISFDYAIVEKEAKISVIRYKGEWRDLGTWNTLTEVLPDQLMGNAIVSENCTNTHVLNDLPIPVLCMGIQDAIVTASPEGILISTKDESPKIKSYVENIDQRVMFAEKSWGSFRVLNVCEQGMTLSMEIIPGKRMSYHSHENRDEVWVFLSGKGHVVIDGMERTVSKGDVMTISAGCRHTIIAEEKIELIEVQLGTEISVSDKKKFDL